jgi:glycosyltransferase involved in cell wall biosynthesis
MRIGVATPFFERSAIGKKSAEIVEVLLREGHEAEILRSEVDRVSFAAPHATAAPVHWLADFPADELRRRYDVLVYQVGDNYLYHGAILAYLREVPGVTIVHDFYLYDLFLGWVAAQGHPPGLHDAVIRSFYGEEALRWGSAGRSHLELMERVAKAYPMTEWVTRFAIGAVAHATFYAERLQRSCPGPVAVIPLAAEPRAGIDEHRPAGSKLRLITVGIANPNKRIGALIEALGGSAELRRAYSYRVVGAAEAEHERAFRERAAASGGVDFDITGYVDDEQLMREFTEADVIACLRYPVLEGASASLIEALLSGRPTLVTDRGCYADVPDGCVLKVRPETEVEDLRRSLSWVAGNPREALEIGARGRQWALANTAPEDYTRKLLGLIERAMEVEPLVRTAGQLGGALSSFRIGERSSAMLRIERAMGELFLRGRLSDDGAATP